MPKAIKDKAVRMAWMELQDVSLEKGWQHNNRFVSVSGGVREKGCMRRLQEQAPCSDPLVLLLWYQGCGAG